MTTLPLSAAPIPNLPGYYVTPTGEVWSDRRWVNQMSLFPDAAGYLKTNLYQDGTQKQFYVHRLVLQTFTGECPEGCQACHIDDDPSNNAVGNLYWGTPSQNCRDRLRNGGQATQKLSVKEVREIRKKYNCGSATYTSLADEFDVHPSTIGSIITRRTWRHIDPVAPSTLYAIDPGLREAGIARFEDEQLVSCDVVYCKYGEGPDQWTATSNALAEWIGNSADALAIEYMQTRRGRDDAHDALIQLSQVSGGVYALVNADTMYAVDPTWTRGAKKPVQRRRVLKRLGDDEREAYDAGVHRAMPDNEKEIVAAVGIGLHVLKRY